MTAWQSGEIRSGVRPLLDLEITVRYGARPPALDSARLRIAPGEILGLIGESGSGKSSMALAILGLLGFRGGRAEGRMDFAGRNLLELREKEYRQLRGSRIALVPQAPLASFNPYLSLRRHFEEAWAAHSRQPLPDLAELLGRVSLPASGDLLGRKPGELSIGMAQRALIALALLHGPELVIADEPTSALDVITQSGIRELFGRLRRQTGMAMLFISHDLLSVAAICDRVAILNKGKIVECEATAEIFENPRHLYTKQLVAALPAAPQGAMA